MKLIPPFLLLIGVSYYTSIGIGLLTITLPVIILTVRTWTKATHSTAELNHLLHEKAKIGMEALGATREELGHGV